MHNYASTQMKLSTENIKLHSMVRKNILKDNGDGGSGYPGAMDMGPLMRPQMSNILRQQALWNQPQLDIQVLRRNGNSNTIDGCRIGEVVPQNPFVFIKGQGNSNNTENTGYNYSETKFTRVPLDFSSFFFFSCGVAFFRGLEVILCHTNRGLPSNHIYQQDSCLILNIPVREHRKRFYL